MVKKKQTVQIILVDDDKEDRFLTKNALERCRVSNAVIGFENGEDFIAYLQDNTTQKALTLTPYLVLLDLIYLV